MHRAAHGRHVGSGNPAAVLALVNAAFAVDVPATRTASPATILWANARTESTGIRPSARRDECLWANQSSGVRIARRHQERQVAEGDERIAKELPHPIEIVQKAGANGKYGPRTVSHSSNP